MRGAQQMRSERVEEIARIPVELEHAVDAAVEIGVRLAVKTDDEVGNRLAAPRHLEADAAPAF